MRVGRCAVDGEDGGLGVGEGEVVAVVFGGFDAHGVAEGDEGEDEGVEAFE